MPTGIQSWNNPEAIEAIYPFAGTEVPLAIIGIVLWIVWHFLQNKEESKEWDHATEAFDESRLLPGAGDPQAPRAPMS